VLMPVETRPTGVTTLPAARPSNTPSALPSKDKPTPQTDVRPRRVLTNTP